MKSPKATIRSIFENHNGRRIRKWDNYFEAYERHFDPYRQRDYPLVILEIGVSDGGSLQMWREYFGDSAQIFGVDINPECKNFEDEKTKIFIGSQSDRQFLRKLKSSIPPIDILIDDGGHTMLQ